MSLKSQRRLGVLLMLGMMAGAARGQENMPVGWASVGGGTTGGGVVFAFDAGLPIPKPPHFIPYPARWARRC